MARHINELKNALEFARFQSPDIRDAVSNCIKNIAADMEEVEYEDSIGTITAFRELSACIADFENPNKPQLVAESTGDEDVDRDVPVDDVVDIPDEIEHAIERSISNDIDDDDIDRD